MTYGEYYYLIKYDMKLKDGVWVTNKPRMTVPTKMSREVANTYYNDKFSKYWKSQTFLSTLKS